MKIIKISKCIIVIIMIILNMLGLVGCLAMYFYGKREVFSEGNFLYHKYDEFVIIVGFTEEGRKQKEIAFPNEIDGKKVRSLGNNNILITGGVINYFSEKKDEYGECLVEKVFIPRGISIIWEVSSPTFRGCSLLRKILFISTEPLQNIIENPISVNERITDIKYESYDRLFIVPDGHSESYKNMYNAIIHEANIQFQLNYENENAEELIVQYEKEHINNYGTDSTYYKELIAIYKNDITNNEGIYWIDYLNENEKLTTIPLDPVREGYTFGGWYAESECINLIDVNTFVNEKYTFEFFAKWDIVI